jgi:hypothetical protein
MNRPYKLIHLNNESYGCEMSVGNKGFKIRDGNLVPEIYIFYENLHKVCDYVNHPNLGQSNDYDAISFKIWFTSNEYHWKIDEILIRIYKKDIELYNILKERYENNVMRT